MNIPYHDTATILGFQIKNTVWESALAIWTKITAKIHRTPVPGGTKVAWYMVIHDIVPTNVRLYKI